MAFKTSLLRLGLLTVFCGAVGTSAFLISQRRSETRTSSGSLIQEPTVLENTTLPVPQAEPRPLPPTEAEILAISTATSSEQKIDQLQADNNAAKQLQGVGFETAWQVVLQTSHPYLRELAAMRCGELDPNKGLRLIQNNPELSNRAELISGLF